MVTFSRQTDPQRRPTLIKRQDTIVSCFFATFGTNGYPDQAPDQDAQIRAPRAQFATSFYLRLGRMSGRMPMHCLEQNSTRLVVPSHCHFAKIHEHIMHNVT